MEMIKQKTITKECHGRRSEKDKIQFHSFSETQKNEETTHKNLNKTYKI